MSDQTPQFTQLTVQLDFNENALQRILAAAKTLDQRRVAVPLTCTVFDASTGNTLQTFEVDASRCSKRLLGELSDDECHLRTFFYLNGLLNALKKLRLCYRSCRAVTFETKVRYLQNNASFDRVQKWKKSGFKGAQGNAIRLPALWNEFYGWCTGPLAFHPLQVKELQQ